MNEKDILSLSRQVTDCYSTNKKSQIPFNLIIYDADQKLINCLAKNNYDKWVGFNLIKKGQYKNILEYVQNIKDVKETDIHEIKNKICYLTADSTNEINLLKNDEIYIIGGLVDRNKHKLLCFNKANQIGINHGRLPIGEYLELKSSKVLATNHVFSILTHFNNKSQNWKEAFLSIIPKRKFEENKNS